MTNKNTKTETKKKPAFRPEKNVHISTNATLARKIAHNALK